MSGSLRERRKSFKVPVTTWISTCASWDCPLPRNRRSYEQRINSIIFFPIFFCQLNYLQVFNFFLRTVNTVEANLWQTTSFDFVDAVNDQAGNHGWHVRNIISNSDKALVRRRLNGRDTRRRHTRFAIYMTNSSTFNALQSCFAKFDPRRSET